MTEIEKMVLLHTEWRKNPILAIKSLFGVTPTKQQEGLVLAAWEDQARVAVSSCQGAGKTATLVWLMFLFLLLLEDCRVLVTSPSYQQLSRVFNSEVHKWHSKMPKIYQEQFIIQKEKIALKGKEGFQFASLVTASAEHEENLQGGHAENYIILADEASGISEHVFDVLLGTLSTGNGGRFIMTSNPLRASGRFYDIFSRELERWVRMFFSAYDSPVINATHIEDMAKMYGDDSDIFRVRILGRFPRLSSTQFLSDELIATSTNTWLELQDYGRHPKIMGVDVARFGDDETVFVLRQGPKLHEIKRYRGLDNMEVVRELIAVQMRWLPNLICIDATGTGTGVYDRAKELSLPVHPVVVGQKSTDPMRYLNLRAQLYGLMKEWFEYNCDIPNDEELRKQLLSIEYGFNAKMQFQMLGKKDIKAKGLPSPDIVDAITMTFAKQAVAKNEVKTKARPVVQSKYLWV